MKEIVSPAQISAAYFVRFPHLLSAITIHMQWQERRNSAAIIDRSSRWEGIVLLLERAQLWGTQVNNCLSLSQIECTLNLYYYFAFNFWCALNYSGVFNLLKCFVSYSPASFLKRWCSRWFKLNIEYLFEFRFNVKKTTDRLPLFKQWYQKV